MDDVTSSGGTIDYSTTEVDTGSKWIDGKNVYQIVLWVTGFTTPSNITHNLDIDTYIKIEGFTFNPASPNNVEALNRNSSLTLGQHIFNTLQPNSIQTVETDTDCTTVYFILRYTKN